MLEEETQDYKIEQLEIRQSRLTGKIATIKVGAATQVEKEELRYRVDDAIQATRAARDGGVVPGGATTMLWASQLEGLEPLVAEALKRVFRKLMENGGQEGGYRLMQALNSKWGWGFNLREMTDKPVDLLKGGVIDPTKVMVQVVQNACSVAGNIITTGCVVKLGDWTEEQKTE
jgi:chaperonin GroEL